MARDVYNDKEFQRYLRKLRRLGENARPMMRGIGFLVEAGIREEFDTEGHGRWPTLKTEDKKGRPYRRVRRGQKQYVFKLLQDRGTLVKSITTKILSNTSFITGCGGAAKDYAEYQNKLREFIVLSAETIRRIRREIRRWLKF